MRVGASSAAARCGSGARCEDGIAKRGRAWRQDGVGMRGGNRERVAERGFDRPAAPCKTRTQQCRIPHFSSDPLNRRPFRPERAPSERFIVSRLILRSNSNAGFSSLDDTRPVRLETTRTLGRSDSRRQASELGFHLNSQAPGKRSKANRLPHRPRNVDHWRKTCIQERFHDQNGDPIVSLAAFLNICSCIVILKSAINATALTRRSSTSPAPTKFSPESEEQEIVRSSIETERL